ncbi:hypothetical protein SERLA73DRAFT_174040 [Serpula lacrymans var. lacrymans S7.3]|uniref:Uncharacterized protein n=2 Tax=Serpula lacrymans var. lacrymans TaxID=341189 RepID=F8PHC9_SERL3|nr:uncharacterized protein SERLADRAFT_455058 [Serpula lacrymans var. lacrymans S7.9]EGO04975.1 hypothetical protein SERLA73DRAFT_174040 [Serpula lacrymans var. lacrymans S7.3]EGO30769.1 hypothetical protein SERLADRAFT_455058 [Serpula lacrymans var. lacrymans S7.9]
MKPVILGVTPSPDSHHAFGRRTFSNQKMDNKGLPCRTNPTISLVKKNKKDQRRLRHQPRVGSSTTMTLWPITTTHPRKNPVIRKE